MASFRHSVIQIQRVAVLHEDFLRKTWPMAEISSSSPPRRGGRRRVCAEPRVLIQCYMPAWALDQVLELAEQVHMTRTDLAGLCMTEELNLLRVTRGLPEISVPSYLLKAAVDLPPRRYIDEPLLDERSFWTSGDQVVFKALRFRVPKSAAEGLASAARSLNSTQSLLAIWLVLQGANRIRTALGMPTTPLPDKAADLAAHAGATPTLEALLVS